MKMALMTTWTSPVPGREARSIEYAREVDEFWGKQAAEGRCTEPEWFWASQGPHTWLVTGEADQLQQLLASPEVQHLLTKGSLLIQDFGWGLSVCGREANLAPYEAVANELGLS